VNAPSFSPSAFSPAAGQPPVATAPRYLCFARFQIDLRRELLFKDGAPVRLPGKVYHALLMLAGKPGQVVTREELRASLWPEGTFVNFDANLNTTMNKLRAVLEDDPAVPTYIETIPRLGYCFVGSVRASDELAAPHGTASSKSAPNAAARVAAAALLPDRANSSPAGTRQGAVPKLWAAAVLLCGMLLGFVAVFLARR